MALLTGELQIAKQWVETDQMTCMATQWSHSTPVMSLIAQEQVGQYMHQVGQCQNDVGYTSTLGLCPHRYLAMGDSHNLHLVAFLVLT